MGTDQREAFQVIITSFAEHQKFSVKYGGKTRGHRQLRLSAPGWGGVGWRTSGPGSNHCSSVRLNHDLCQEKKNKTEKKTRKVGMDSSRDEPRIQQVPANQHLCLKMTQSRVPTIHSQVKSNIRLWWCERRMHGSWRLPEASNTLEPV